MDKSAKLLIAGAGGFIGGHLVKYYLDKGFKNIRTVDIKPLNRWYQVHKNVENTVADLSIRENCYKVTEGINYAYNLAADMGGMGFIENHKALCMLSVLINTHLLLASKDNDVSRYFFSSSACVYAADKQTDPHNPGLKESDAYPAMPEDGYGWEKLFSERMCRHFTEDFGLQTRVARFHNVYGPFGTYDGGREKAPAALCRKIITAKLSGNHNIEVWGDGEQSRTFMYIDDCTKGIDMIMQSDIQIPINLGRSELVTINQMIDIIEAIAGIKVERNYNLQAPKGVRGRSSDNTLTKKLLRWEPEISLKNGLKKTYDWIYKEMDLK